MKHLFQPPLHRKKLQFSVFVVGFFSVQLFACNRQQFTWRTQSINEIWGIVSFISVLIFATIFSHLSFAFTLESYHFFFISSFYHFPLAFIHSIHFLIGLFACQLAHMCSIQTIYSMFFVIVVSLLFFYSMFSLVWLLRAWRLIELRDSSHSGHRQTFIYKLN